MKLSNTPMGTTSRQINGSPSICPRCAEAILMSDEEQERNICNDCFDQDDLDQSRAVPIDDSMPMPKSGESPAGCESNGGKDSERHGQTYAVPVKSEDCPTNQFNQ